MTDSAIVMEAVETLLGAAPGSQVILFGSYARGNAGPDSDLDFLVIEPEIHGRLREMVRLRDALDHVLKSHRIPADVIVVSRNQFEKWRHTPSTVYYKADREGKSYGVTG